MQIACHGSPTAAVSSHRIFLYGLDILRACIARSLRWLMSTPENQESDFRGRKQQQLAAAIFVSTFGKQSFACEEVAAWRRDPSKASPNMMTTTKKRGRLHVQGRVGRFGTPAHPPADTTPEDPVGTFPHLPTQFTASLSDMCVRYMHHHKHRRAHPPVNDNSPKKRHTHPGHAVAEPPGWSFSPR